MKSLVFAISMLLIVSFFEKTFSISLGGTAMWRAAGKHETHNKRDVTIKAFMLLEFCSDWQRHIQSSIKNLRWNFLRK